jgi:hypothetical protein
VPGGLAAAAPQRPLTPSRPARGRLAGQADQGHGVVVVQAVKGRRVAKLMRVQPRQAGLLAAAADELLDAPGGQPAALAKPEPGKLGVLVPGADAKVAVQRHGGLASVG